jgi:hypothetical protein
MSIGNNVSWFVIFWETWHGNNVSWFAHFVWVTWLGSNVSRNKKFEFYYLPE